MFPTTLVGHYDFPPNITHLTVRGSVYRSRMLFNNNNNNDINTPLLPPTLTFINCEGVFMEPLEFLPNSLTHVVCGRESISFRENLNITHLFFRRYGGFPLCLNIPKSHALVEHRNSSLFTRNMKILAPVERLKPLFARDTHVEFFCSREGFSDFCLLDKLEKMILQHIG